MKTSKFTEEQIAFALRQVMAGPFLSDEIHKNRHTYGMCSYSFRRLGLGTKRGTRRQYSS
jgi:hypothetical protein